ncbi:hypothetical protein N311_11269, partial [Apaloderma vittatum]
TPGSAGQVQSSKLSASSQHRDYQQQHLNFDPRRSNRPGGNTQRLQVPSTWKEKMADRLFPHLYKKPLPITFVQLQKQRLLQK